jgi:hypothetical protein
VANNLPGIGAEQKLRHRGAVWANDNQIGLKVVSYGKNFSIGATARADHRGSAG